MITQLSHVFYFCCYKCWTATGEARKNHLGILWSKDQQRQSSLTLGKCAFDTVDGSEILHQLILSHYLQGFTYIYIYIYIYINWLSGISGPSTLFKLRWTPFQLIHVSYRFRLSLLWFRFNSGGCCQCTEGTKRDGRSDFWSYLQTKAQEWVVLPLGERYGKGIIQKWFQKMSFICWIGWDVLCSWAFFFLWGWGEVEGWIYSVSMDRWSPYCCHIFNGICIRPFRKIRNYAGVTQAWGTLLCDTMFWKIMVTSSKDC